MKKFNGKIIIIWGLGITGKAAISFFNKHFPSCKMITIDQKEPTGQAKDFLLEHKTNFEKYDKLESLLESSDYIFPSPGIDASLYKKFNNKFISEVDVFQQHKNGETIAITGTLGKTTITSMLSQIIEQNNHKVCTGGNIGTSLFDLIEKQKDVDYNVLELSSFQLENTKNFAPDLAIWTNFYSNHLDRHKTLDEYKKAKMNIYKYQNQAQKILLNTQILENTSSKELTNINSKLSFFSENHPSNSLIKSFPENTKWFYSKDKNLVIKTKNKESIIAQLPNNEKTFPINWITMYSALSLLKIPIPNNEILSAVQPVSEHRIEHLGQQNKIHFYNDSKATIPQSTMAAIRKLNHKHITLIIGGISKGVDREHFIKEIRNEVQHTVCFGKESVQLAQWCKKYSVPFNKSENLETALILAIKNTPQKGCVLFSPSGASFDLYLNYIERGNNFKNLLKTVIGQES